MTQHPFICASKLSFYDCYALYHEKMLLFGALADYPYSFASDSIAEHFPFSKPSQPAPNDHLTIFQIAPQSPPTAPSPPSTKEHDQ